MGGAHAVLTTPLSCRCMEPQEESCEELDSYSGDESEGGRFPGLNKAHGFFNLIKRNQRDRDTYHQEQEELREVYTGLHPIINRLQVLCVTGQKVGSEERLAE